MKDFKLESTFKLTVPFDYGNGLAKQLHLKAPTAHHLVYVSKIEECIGRARKCVQMDFIASIGSMDDIAKMAEGNTNKEDEKEDGAAIIELLKNSGEFSDFCGYFKDFICGESICQINGKDDMKGGWYDCMMIKDVYGLMEKYLSDFFMQ